MQNSDIPKIAIVGPESTGKSSMSAYLAEHYHTVWVPEFARDYCAALTEPPTWQDEINMFYGQLALEEKLLPQANKLLICDTTFITVKIWSDQMFGSSPQEVLDALPKHKYDLYLLLKMAGIGGYAVLALLFHINVIRLVRRADVQRRHPGAPAGENCRHPSSR